MKKRFRNLFILAIVSGLSLIGNSCNIPPSDYFQKEIAIRNASWPADLQPVFTIDIKDVSAKYQTYILLRNDDSYPFSNIWLLLSVKQPGRAAFSPGKLINLQLADIQGAWLGRGMGSLWEHKIPFNDKDNLRFPEKGIYQVRIAQVMRQNPLSGILNVGLAVEKR